MARSDAYSGSDVPTAIATGSVVIAETDAIAGIYDVNAKVESIGYTACN